eukprot:TRINITY_DN18909_c0_g1_i1.p1 TRINITY_DN18909_c0_g1~~TRINITY_DN18909_c0_g1_i1.p1  ORF type:complete len:114 (+),score=15.97 TRINITY_DN18909_c0_g1_i1:316-657(+)
MRLSIVFLSLLSFGVCLSLPFVPGAEGACSDWEVENTLCRETHGEGRPMKLEWPELVGIPFEDAKQIVEAEADNVRTIQAVPKGFAVTMDFREDRVRIFVDENKKVIRPPRIG